MQVHSLLTRKSCLSGAQLLSYITSGTSSKNEVNYMKETLEILCYNNVPVNAERANWIQPVAASEEQHCIDVLTKKEKLKKEKRKKAHEHHLVADHYFSIHSW